MNDAVSQKRPRIRESPKLYARLRREILERDGWRCQKCGHSGNLDVHHVNRRNAVGDDAETNLITVCGECHKMLHRSVDGLPSGGRLGFFPFGDSEPSSGPHLPSLEIPCTVTPFVWGMFEVERPNAVFFIASRRPGATAKAK
jgi:hypothetical protein